MFLSDTSTSIIAASVVGGLLAFVILCLAVAVFIRRRRIKRKRTLRRLLQEREVRLNKKTHSCFNKRAKGSCHNAEFSVMIGLEVDRKNSRFLM